MTHKQYPINKKYLIKVKEYMFHYPRLRRRILVNDGEFLPIILIGEP